MADIAHPILYFAAGTRSTRPCWLLEECGVPYILEAIELFKGEHKQPAYLTINPMGKVPAFREGDRIIVETLGICLHIADRYGMGKIVPEMADEKRAEYYQWMAYSVGSLEAALLEEVRRKNAEKAGENFTPLRLQLPSFESVAQLLEGELGKHDYLLGDNFSAADALNGSGMFWARSFGLLEGFERIQDWLKRLENRPAYKRMLEISKA